MNMFQFLADQLSLKMYEHSLDQCLVTSQHHLWALVHGPRSAAELTGRPEYSLEQ